jgi:hypothetical protein
MTRARAEWKAETLSITPPIGESPMRTAAAGASARTSRLTSIELAECILATDAAACRDNLAYSARRSGVARRSSVGTVIAPRGPTGQCRTVCPLPRTVSRAVRGSGAPQSRTQQAPGET